MPEAINTVHIALTLIAVGILFGVGFALAQLAVKYPATSASIGAALACAILVALAWLV